MNFEKKITAKKAVIFGLDNVIYPEKDYLLQVYYLFAQFIEYTEQIDGGPVVAFMRDHLETDGQDGIFEKMAAKFSIPLKYDENFKSLHKTAKLPLKLLLFKNTLSLMQEIKAQGKSLILLADGDPEIQLNKIRQIEWNGLETYIKVYFLAEFNLPATAAIAMILTTLGFEKSDTLIIDENL